MPVVALQLRVIIVNRPEAKFHHLAFAQLTRPWEGELVKGDFEVGRDAVGVSMVVAQKDAAELAVDGIGKLPFLDFLIVGIRIGRSGIHIERQRVAQGMGAGVIVVVPTYIEAVEVERVGVFVARSGEQGGGEQEEKRGAFHTFCILGKRKNYAGFWQGVSEGLAQV